MTRIGGIAAGRSKSAFWAQPTVEPVDTAGSRHINRRFVVNASEILYN